MVKDSQRKQGFLPIKTNLWDRFFIGMVIFVAIHLLWMRFLEAHLPLPVGTILSLIILVVIVIKG